jgi:hypothetical protein
MPFTDDHVVAHHAWSGGRPPHQVRALQAAIWSSISQTMMAIRDKALDIGGWCPSIVNENS